MDSLDSMAVISGLSAQKLDLLPISEDMFAVVFGLLLAMSPSVLTSSWLRRVMGRSVIALHSEAKWIGDTSVNLTAIR